MVLWQDQHANESLERAPTRLPDRCLVRLPDQCRCTCFTKAQQDALVPHDEDGTIALVGATPDNPYSVTDAVTL
jgi:replication-associated recombination protein RarA